MPRYVMSYRRAGKLQSGDKAAARQAMALAFQELQPHVSVVNETRPDNATSRRSVLFEAHADVIEELKTTATPDVIIEPERLYHPSTLCPVDFLQINSQSQGNHLVPGSGQTLTVRVTAGHGIIPETRVLLFLQGPGQQRTQSSMTIPQSGEVTFQYGLTWCPSALIVAPSSGFWPLIKRGPRDPIDIELIPLPAEGPTAWWHRIVGLRKYQVNRGKGIKVGIIDTGVKPNSSLDHVVDIGSFINGVVDPNGGGDVDSHGSHVCGIVGARPLANGQYAGVAPGVSLFSARVFPVLGGANQLDIANAIEELSGDSHQVDLINMSLGSPYPSEIMKDAILDALERGTLCICAAGNGGGAIEYPAAFDETVSVSTLGVLGWGPPGSLAESRVPLDQRLFGDQNLYLANFSYFGDNLNICAPGVGIISTVRSPAGDGPMSSYGAMDGTSMASPVACAVLAHHLARSRVYKGLPRDRTRSAKARQLLLNSCLDIGMPTQFQGRGLVQV